MSALIVLQRRQTLLVELQQKNKVGGIIDRRIGENDPTLAPEEKMLKRFAAEKQRRLRGADLFNLDDDEELTHFGKSLGGLDDFEEDDLMQDDDDEDITGKKRKAIEDGDDEEEQPERKKTKAEIMKEVIAKSKLHKYERQKAKEEDQDVREQLDAELKDLWPLLQGAGPKMNPDRLANITGDDSAKKAEKSYDAAVKEMIFDQRAAPADRTKTEEEKAAEEAERLRKLEEARLKRMRGEEDSDEEMEEEKKKEKKHGNLDEFDEDEMEIGEAEHFGFGKRSYESSSKAAYSNPDEILDEKFIAGEDLELDEEEIDGLLNDVDGAEFEDDYNSDVSDVEGDEDSDAEFLADVMPVKQAQQEKKESEKPESDAIAFTYPCPSTHSEFLDILKDVPVEEVPTVVRRIRVLYHPRLAEGNKAKLETFATIILEHILYLAKTVKPFPSSTIDTLTRHLHVLTRASPQGTIPDKFRELVRSICEKRPLDVTPSDLILFNTIGIIFPTSDNFHPIVTPVHLALGRYLDQSTPDSLAKLARGGYACMVVAQYQQLSKRFIPEALNYIFQALAMLSPKPLEKLPGTFSGRSITTALSIRKTDGEWQPRQINFADLSPKKNDSDLSRTLLCFFSSLLVKFADLWVGKVAFTEAFEPGKQLIDHILKKDSRKILNSPQLVDMLKKTSKKLQDMLARAQLTRRPLELHHHRPLPIPSHYPKFEETYSLDKRYDPDRDRLEAAKLRAEYKKERKGALRELRKDAAFIAREKIREETLASKEYHAKMRRLTAMIQSEEGAASNAYEREKRARSKKKR